MVKNQETVEQENKSGSSFSVSDGFFFYPIYLENKNLAKKLFRTYFYFLPNRAEVIKEIISVDALLCNQTISMRNFFDTINVNPIYPAVLVDYIRRRENYALLNGKVLFNTSEDLEKYADYLMSLSNPAQKDMEKVYNRMLRKYTQGL